MPNYPFLATVFVFVFVSIGSLYADDEKRVTVDSAATTVTQVPAASERVIRSAAELEKETFDGLMTSVLKLDAVDFEKQMVVVIRSGMTNAFGVRLDILSTGVEGGTLTVHWRFKPYFGGAAPPDQPGNPTLVLVLDRHGGEVRFRRSDWKLPEGVPPPPGVAPPVPQ